MSDSPDDIAARAAFAMHVVDEIFNLGIDDMVALAKRQCPHDTGDLESTIRREGQGRNAIVTYGSPGTASYEDLIHEDYESLGGMGRNTAAKQAADPGVVIGSHFVTRAVDAIAPKMTEAIEAAVRKAMGG